MAPKLLEKIAFKGHKNVRATHKSTLELTKDSYLTPRGDCIIGVESDKSVADLSEETKRYIRSGRPLVIEIVVPRYKFTFLAYGDPRLPLTDDRSLVIRKSRYVCPRTLAVRSTASARDVPREIVRELKKGAQGHMFIYEAL